MHLKTCVMTQVVSWQFITAEADIEVGVQLQDSACWICGE
jgi:hypothetical protein